MNARIDPADVKWGPDGLVPAIVQSAADGRVLMLAYVDAEALAATYATGEVHFHSRSRNRLWRKGEESGHILEFVDVAGDCDTDSLLFTANAVGPTCHRNTRSCFDPAGAAPIADGAQVTSAQGFAWLETLWTTIDERAAADPEESYTARLIAKGVWGPTRKVAEEATEVMMAAKDDESAGPDNRAETRDALTGEVADLLYHALVVLRERGLPPSAVIDRLRERHKA